MFAAEENCQALNVESEKPAHLATVNSAEENTFLLKLANDEGIKGEQWLGFTDAYTEGTFVSLDGSGVASYQNWTTGKPASTARKNCVGLGDQGWVNTPCAGYPRAFSCSYTSFTHSTTSAPLKACPWGSTQGTGTNSDRCYKVQKAVMKTRAIADAYCRSMSPRAELLSVRSADELVFAHKLMEDAFGGANAGFMWSAWVSLNDAAEENAYKNSDGVCPEPSVELLTSEKAYRKDHSGKHCVVFWDDGKLYSEPCDEFQAHWICYIGLENASKGNCAKSSSGGSKASGSLGTATTGSGGANTTTEKRSAGNGPDVPGSSTTTSATTIAGGAGANAGGVTAAGEVEHAMDKADHQATPSGETGVADPLPSSHDLFFLQEDQLEHHDRLRGSVQYFSYFILDRQQEQRELLPKPDDEAHKDPTGSVLEKIAEYHESIAKVLEIQDTVDTVGGPEDERISIQDVSEKVQEDSAPVSAFVEVGAKVSTGGAATRQSQTAGHETTSKGIFSMFSGMFGGSSETEDQTEDNVETNTASTDEIIPDPDPEDIKTSTLAKANAEALKGREALEVDYSMFNVKLGSENAEYNESLVKETLSFETAVKSCNKNEDCGCVVGRVFDFAESKKLMQELAAKKAKEKDSIHGEAHLDDHKHHKEGHDGVWDVLRFLGDHSSKVQAHVTSNTTNRLLKTKTPLTVYKQKTLDQCETDPEVADFIVWKRNQIDTSSVLDLEGVNMENDVESLLGSNARASMMSMTSDKAKQTTSFNKPLHQGSSLVEKDAGEEVNAKSQYILHDSDGNTSSEDPTDRLDEERANKIPHRDLTRDMTSNDMMAHKIEQTTVFGDEANEKNALSSRQSVGESTETPISTRPPPSAPGQSSVVSNFSISSKNNTTAGPTTTSTATNINSTAANNDTDASSKSSNQSSIPEQSYDKAGPSGVVSRPASSFYYGNDVDLDWDISHLAGRGNGVEQALGGGGVDVGVGRVYLEEGSRDSESEELRFGMPPRSCASCLESELEIWLSKDFLSHEALGESSHLKVSDDSPANVDSDTAAKQQQQTSLAYVDVTTSTPANAISRLLINKLHTTLNSLGQLPKSCIDRLSSIYISQKDRPWTIGNNRMGFGLWYVEGRQNSVDSRGMNHNDILKKLLLHECGHVMLDDMSYVKDYGVKDGEQYDEKVKDRLRKYQLQPATGDADWRRAVENDDKCYVSKYSAENQKIEDVAESFVAWWDFHQFWDHDGSVIEKEALETARAQEGAPSSTILSKLVLTPDGSELLASSKKGDSSGRKLSSFNTSSNMLEYEGDTTDHSDSQNQERQLTRRKQIIKDQIGHRLEYFDKVFGENKKELQIGPVKMCKSWTSAESRSEVEVVNQPNDTGSASNFAKIPDGPITNQKVNPSVKPPGEKSNAASRVSSSEAPPPTEERQKGLQNESGSRTITKSYNVGCHHRNFKNQDTVLESERRNNANGDRDFELHPSGSFLKTHDEQKQEFGKESSKSFGKNLSTCALDRSNNKSNTAQQLSSSKGHGTNLLHENLTDQSVTTCDAKMNNARRICACKNPIVLLER